MQHEHSAPTNLVLFGITGDLVQKKILQALYSLYKKGHFPPLFNIIGLARKDMSDEQLREYVVEHLKFEVQQEFLEYFSYVQGTFEDPGSYKKLHKLLGEIESEWDTCSNRLFYLAVPPSFYEVIFTNLDSSELMKPCSDADGWSRIIVEKPFGSDLGTAQKLEQLLSSLFEEEQIYRIDHYLGKEIMQNMIVFRFSNNLLEHSWDNSMIEKIEVKFMETLDIQNRGSFYDGVGALRDVGQNHMLQMLSIVTMSDPLELTSEKIRKNRATILDSLKLLSIEDVKNNTVRAQYNGYKDVEGVAPDSTTETYFRIQAEFDNNKWFGVPVILEGGKGFAKNELQTVVTFKGKHENKIVFNMEKKDMGIYVHLKSKKPGISTEVEDKVFAMPICDDPNECDFAFAYEKLLEDCFRGNQTLFVSTDEVMASWRFVDPILNAWREENVSELKTYDLGSPNDFFSN